MNSRPYLDKLVTSPHIPKQPGQVGYCSRKLIPDLSCSGIHSDLDPKTETITTADGKLTKTFVMNAYRTMRELQRGLTVLDAKEEIFKLDHRQYIDKLLVDMETEKKEKHERRMRHFKRKKDSMGFEGSFESAFTTGGSSSWQPISTKAGEYQSSEFGDFRSSNATPHPDSRNSSARHSDANEKSDPHISEFEAARRIAVSRAGNSVRFNESPHEFNSRPTTKEENAVSSHTAATTTTRGSLISTGSGGSAYGTRADTAKQIKKHSRMALFNSLLEVVEPPPSPVRRFGSIQITPTAGMTGTPLERYGSLCFEPGLRSSSEAGGPK